MNPCMNDASHHTKDGGTACPMPGVGDRRDRAREVVRHIGDAELDLVDPPGGRSPPPCRGRGLDAVTNTANNATKGVLEAEEVPGPEERGHGGTGQGEGATRTGG